LLCCELGRGASILDWGSTLFLIVRVLLIAPDSDLPGASDEVDAIIGATGLVVRLLSGAVVERDIISELDDHPTDLLWVAGHGNQSGIVLSDGTWPTEAITAIVRAHSIKYVFLNSCSSIYTANTIAEDGGADVICTLIDIPDKTAYRTGALLARRLAAHDGSFRLAYESSRPGANSSYVYIPADLGDRNRMGNGQGQTRGAFEIWARDEIYSLRERMILLEQVFAGKGSIPFSVYVAGFAIAIALISYLLVSFPGGG